MAAIDHDLNAVATTALVGVTDERDIVRTLRRDHGLPP
jgi:hypothetical protein